MRHFVARNHIRCRSEKLHPEHGLSASFERPVVLFAILFRYFIWRISTAMPLSSLIWSMAYMHTPLVSFVTCLGKSFLSNIAFSKKRIAAFSSCLSTTVLLRHAHSVFAHLKKKKV
jgi:hypothetical protein